MFTPSIITSFITNGFLSRDTQHQNNIRDCFLHLREVFAEYYLGDENANGFWLPIELYIFMEPDFQYLKEEFELPDDFTQVKFLKTLTEDPELLEKTFQLLSKYFSELKISPIAIASFFPEISHTDEVRKSDALNAVAGMQRLAQYFNEKGDYNIRAIELVCGSRIKGLAIEHDEKEKKDVLISRLIPEEEIVSALQKIIDGLHKTVEAYPDEKVVPYALELEPGSLFLANSGKSLTQLAKLLEHSKHIGFNLDLSHFCLAGLLEQLKQADNSAGPFQLSSEITNSDSFESFENRIVHSHISDSSDKGHLGDLPFGSFHNDDYFKKQIQFLARLISKKNSKVPFSNHLSMELEAMGSWQEIRNSFKTLCILCKSIEN